MVYGDFYITECDGMPFVIILSTEGTSEYWDELKKRLCVKGNEGRTVMFNFMYRNGDSRKAYFTSVVSDDLSDLSELKQCVYEKSMRRFELEIDLYDGEAFPEELTVRVRFERAEVER